MNRFYVAILYLFLGSFLVAETQKSSEDEQMVLMYKSFTFTSDLQSAFEVVQIALEKNPDSLFWHQKGAEVSEWLGKQQEAIEHYNFIYKKTKDEAIGEKMLQYAFAKHEFTVVEPILKEKVKRNPTPQNIKDMVYVYHSLGTPEEAATLLESLYEKQKIDAVGLEEALRIYMLIGDEEGSQRVVERLESSDYTHSTGALLSSYYMAKKGDSESYHALVGVKHFAPDENQTAHYQQVSDHGWHLQYFKEAAEASKELFLSGKARMVDIERILVFYGDKDEDLTMKATIEGYKKFNKKGLYEQYLYGLFERKLYPWLIKEFAKIEGDKGYADMTSKSYYWLMKAQVYMALKDFDSVHEAYLQALRIEPNSPSILTAILWLHIDRNDSHRLERMIWEFEEGGLATKKDFWLPLAVGHFQMQRTDRAMSYIKRLLDDSPNTIEYKLLYANILQIREEEDGFMGVMRGIYKELHEKKGRSPQLMQQKTFLEYYLKSAVYFISPDRFERLLEGSKKTLGQKSYDDIKIFWTLRNDSQEMVHHLTQKLSIIEPWLRLNMALSRDDRGEMLALLERYEKQLPVRDQVTAAQKTFNIASAQSSAFDGMEENGWDVSLYKQHRDMVEEYGDFIQLQTGYRHSLGLGETYMKGEGRDDIARGWRGVWSYDYSSYVKQGEEKTKYYREVPSETIVLRLGVEKLFERGKGGVVLHTTSAIEDFYGVSGWLEYQITSRLSMSGEYSNNVKATETSYLNLGGKKDEYAMSFGYQLLPSTKIKIDYHHQEFFSQDDYHLGGGDTLRIEWNHQLRSGYPDMAWSLYADMGKYEKVDGDAGVLEAIMATEDTRLIPEEYCNVGGRFSYGMQNRHLYTRVWRPFGEIAATYSICNDGGVNFSGSIGYGGSVFGQDHLVIGVGYDQAVSGTQESRAEIYLNYKYFY